MFGTQVANQQKLLVVDQQAELSELCRFAFLAERALPASDEETAGRPFKQSRAEACQLDFVPSQAACVETVRTAELSTSPYAVVFLNVVEMACIELVELVQCLGSVAPNLQLVVCADHATSAVAQAMQTLDWPDRVLVVRRPWTVVELRQAWHVMAGKHKAEWLRQGSAGGEAPTLAATMRVLQILEQSQQELEQAEGCTRRQNVELNKLVADLTREVTATRDAAVFALARLAESRDSDTGAHLERIRSYSQALAEQLRESSRYERVIDDQFLEDLYRSSPLHDIGKVGVPDAILLKPGKLTSDEFEIMKGHTEIGALALERAAREAGCSGFLAMAIAVARSHHERFNGTGYPHKLSGESIPLAARIVAVADVFDALTSARVYKPALEPQVARLMIEEESGRHFDPPIVEAFHACYEKFLEIGIRHRDEANSLFEDLASKSLVGVG